MDPRDAEGGYVHRDPPTRYFAFDAQWCENVRSICLIFVNYFVNSERI